MNTFKNYKNLLKVILYGRPDPNPNLDARRQILKYKNGKKGRVAIWHKKEKKWLDKYGNEYKRKELFI